MKVLAIVAVIAFAAVVRAAPTTDLADEFADEQISELALMPDDDKEISKIKPEMTIFSDFCIRSRDEVRRYLGASANSAASKVFNIMFNTLNEVGSESLKMQHQAVKEGAELIKNANSVQPESGNQIEQELEQKAVQNGGLLSTVGASVRMVLKTVVDTISREAAKWPAYLKANFSGENVREQIREACYDISFNLKKILNNNLKAAKMELLESSSAAQYKDVISSARLEDIGCITTGRVNMVGTFCDVLGAAGPIIYPVLGL